MKKLIILTLLMASSFGARADFSKPDFAFPQTVIENAESKLGDRNGLTRMQAVMQVATARASLGRDSAMTVPKFIAHQASFEKEANIRGLMLLYEAVKLNDIYNGNRWAYNRVEAPLEPLPADIAKWSGDQFRQQIKLLTESALSVLEPYYKDPIKDYKAVLNIDQSSEDFYPHLSDFVFSIASDIADKSFAADAMKAAREGSPSWAMWAARLNENCDSLTALYNRYPQGLTGAYLLNRALDGQSGNYDFGERQLKAIEMLRAYLKDNSVNVLTPALSDKLQSLVRPRISMEAPQAVAVNQEFQLVCKYGFTNFIGYEIYRDDTPSAPSRDHQLTLVSTVKRDTDKNQGLATDTLTAKISKAGNYVIKPLVSGEGKQSVNMLNVVVTPWMPAVFAVGNQTAVIVADYQSGEPSKGVAVAFAGENHRVPMSLVGVSDAEGLLRFTSSKQLNKGWSHPMQLSAGASKVYFGYDAIYQSYHSETPRTWTTAGYFVSRPAYHPGDTVEWSFVAVEKDPVNGKSTLLKDKQFDMVLRDANYQAVDTVKVTTDSFGRGYGSFALPTDRLSGRWSLMLKDGQSIETATVVVSDFKAPVIELIDFKVAEDGLDYVFTGRARRYSGASVPGADVKINISTYWFWNFGEQTNVDLTLDGTTDDTGAFRIVLPKDSLPEGSYRANATVTTVTSEVAEGSCGFRAGKPYAISSQTGTIWADAGTASKLQVMAIDNSLKPARVEAHWALMRNDKAVAIGNCTIDTTGITIAWSSKIDAGHYKLKIYPLEPSQFEEREVADVWIYNTSKNAVPEGAVVMTPSAEIENVSGREAEITVGVDCEQSVYAITESESGALDVSLHKLPRGFSKIKVDVDAAESQQLILLAVRDGKVVTRNVNILRPQPDKKLTLRGESFRDRLVPGSPEQWHLILGNAKGQGTAAALVATMYNGALDAMASLSWPSRLESILQSVKAKPQLRTSWPTYDSQNTFWTTSIKYGRNQAIVAPSFMYAAMQKYGANLMTEKQLYVRGTVSAPMYSANNVVMDAMAATEESAEAEMEAAPAAGNADSGEEKPFDYRAAETLQAFWMPALTIDDNGEATLNFTTPNAVGQWAFHASAWTSDFRAASMTATLQASKPVMAQATLPRFLRQGDRVGLLSTVMNTTDDERRVIATVEIFDPATDAILASKTDTLALAPRSQKLVAIDFEAAVGMDAVGYRVKAGDGQFSDGEQAVIPVIEASTTAIDSQLFYLNDENSQFKATIPADKKGTGIVALQYCQNPVWEAVRSLPGLYDREPRTASGAASSAYAAFIAKGLLERYPEIRDVLEIWRSQPGDSSLVSRLYKNEDMKLALLAQTPFVGAANANTAQMERLAMTFDDDVIDGVIRAAVAKLAQLQGADGGFSWGSWTRQSSIWITRDVTATFGMLGSLGFKADNDRLAKIIDKAFAFIDSSLKDKDDFEYARLYSLYPSRRPSTLLGRQTVENCCQMAVKNWRRQSTAVKAGYALMLHNLGYEAVAREIMSSIGQFASTSATRGTSFDSVKSVDSYTLLLRAFAAIDPGSKLIDGMRQWLVLQTQANDDLGAWNPTSLVAAIVATGESWTAIHDSNTAAVTVDGKPLEITKVEAATGSFSVRIAPADRKRSLLVERAGGSKVSYGSLTTIGSVPLDSVKPRATEGLSIEKRFLVERDGKWVATNEFKLGERVRVQLLVTADRNMEYVTISDQRPAAFEPVDQIAGWTWSGQLGAYRENANQLTRLFVNYLPKGTYYLTYDMTAAFTGSFASGTASLQSQLAPELTARSGACRIAVQ